MTVSMSRPRSSNFSAPRPATPAVGLANDEVDVTTLVAAVGGTKAGISQHLAKLRLAGWINGRRDGRRVVYRVIDNHIVTLVRQGVEHILEEPAARAPMSGGPSSPPGRRERRM
jgi:DNA-binding transcriptional ArsR family regulator